MSEKYSNILKNGVFIKFRKASSENIEKVISTVKVYLKTAFFGACGGPTITILQLFSVVRGVARDGTGRYEGRKFCNSIILHPSSNWTGRREGRKNADGK